MSLALVLSLSLLAQTAPTMVTEVAGTIQSYDLYWDASGHLWLELGGAAVTSINGATPKPPVAIAFGSIDLSLTPAEAAAAPSVTALGSTSGTLRILCGTSLQAATIIPSSPTQVSLGWLYGTEPVFPWTLAPYSFQAFDYGATMVLSLDGDATEILAVLSGKALGTGGTATFALATTPTNRMLHPQIQLPQYVPLGSPVWVYGPRH